VPLAEGHSNSAERSEEGVIAYSFGLFRLDLTRGALFRSEEPVPVRPKSFEVLHQLVLHAGQLLSREELLGAVWPGLVVTDDSLTQCLIEIRRALGDDGREIIRTVPRRGYRFEAEVKVHYSHENEDNPEPKALQKQSRLPSRWTLAALVFLALAIAATWWRAGSDVVTVIPQAGDWEPPPSSIAVLPFADMSESGNQEFLADGIAEEILNLLAQTQELIVIARTSSFSFKPEAPDVRIIARQLNVAHVLEGSVRRSGERVRVTAQLVDGQTGAHVWSETYEEQMGDIFEMQDRIARELANVLHVQLVGDGDQGDYRAVNTPAPEAWEAYSRGRLFYGRRSEGDILRAQTSFESALEIDPGFADAWASLAATINLRMSARNLSPEVRLGPDEATVLIQNALNQALLHDPENPEALWRMAYIKLEVGNTIEAMNFIERAMPLGHNHAVVQAMMAGVAFESGEATLALPFMRRAVALDPLSASLRANLAIFLFSMNHLEAAEDVLTQTIDLIPDPGRRESRTLAWIRIIQGDLESARELMAAIKPGPDLDLTLAIQGHMQGDYESAEKALQRLVSLPAEVGAFRLATVYAMRGDLDAAFESLDLAIQTLPEQPLNWSLRSELAGLRNTPLLKNLHADKRWPPFLEATEELLKDDFNRQVVARLRDHLERHPELYRFDSTSQGPLARTL